MDFGTNLTPIKVIKKVHLVPLILETFILVLMIGGTKTAGKNSKT